MSGYNFLGTNSSLVLMANNGRWWIVERTHDLGGTDYRNVSSLSVDDVPMAHNELGIPFLYDPPDDMVPFLKRKVRGKSRPMKPIPVSAGERIAKDYGYDQVVIVARRVGESPDPHGEHCTTYGIDKVHCGVAARVGSYLQREVMKWHESQSE